MPKILIKINIKNDEQNISYETTGHILNNILTYIDKDGSNMKTSYNYDEDILTRESEAYKMTYYFKERKTIIEDKELRRNMRLGLTDVRIKKEEYNLDIEYKIENNKINYKVEEVE